MNDLFDPTRYPRLRRVCHSNRHGRLEITEVNETSDGFLLGTALIGDPNEPRGIHSIFLGRVEDFT